MEDLAASATIQAAQIQATYSLWAAIVGSFIGGVILLASILYTANHTLKAHKSDKLAEAKRDSYLQLVRKWHKYLMVLNHYRLLNKEDFYDAYQVAVQELTSALHESSFISESATKEKIMKFVVNFSKHHCEAINLIKSWYARDDDFNENKFHVLLLENTEILAIEAQNLEGDLRKELGLSNNEEIEIRIMKNMKEFSKSVKKI